MNPEAYGHDAPPHHQEDVFNELPNEDDFDVAGDFSEVETLEPQIEMSEDFEKIEQTVPETAKEERLGDLDERLRLLDIERGSASRDFENWKSSSQTNPADFQYRVPYMKNRLSAAEQAISSAMIDRELVSSDAETPEAADEVVRSFIKKQLLEGKVKSQREGLKSIDSEEGELNERLVGYERTIDDFQGILEGKSEFVELTDDEWSQEYRKDLTAKIHSVSDKYEATLTDKLSRDFGGRRAALEEEIKAIQALGVDDAELPKSLTEDPDFAACLSEANFNYSEDDEAYKRRTNHDPEKEAAALFKKRFPHKAEFYGRLVATTEDLPQIEEMESLEESEDQDGFYKDLLRDLEGDHDFVSPKEAKKEVLGFGREDYTEFMQRIRDKENVKYVSPEGQEIFAKYVNLQEGKRDNIEGLKREKHLLDVLADSGVTPRTSELKIYPNEKRARLSMEQMPGISLDRMDPDHLDEIFHNNPDTVVRATASALDEIHRMGVLLVDVNEGSFLIDESDENISAYIVDLELGVDLNEDKIEDKDEAFYWYKGKDLALGLDEDIDHQDTEVLRGAEIRLWAKSLVEKMLSYSDMMDPVDLSPEKQRYFEAMKEVIEPVLREGIIKGAEEDYEYRSSRPKEEAFYELPKKEEFIKQKLERELPSKIERELIGITLEERLKLKGIALSKEMLDFLSRALSVEFKRRPTNFGELKL